MRKILTVVTVIVIIAFIYAMPDKQGLRPWTYPHLPYPVAKKKVLVTPAGQSSDGLIVAGMMRELNVSHAYRNTARGEDVTQWYESVVLVLGHSDTGLRKAELTSEEEMERIQGLISATQLKAGAVVLIHLGGQNRRGVKDDALIRRFAPQANYILVADDANNDNIFGRIADKKGIPITLTRDIGSIKAPLNSAFR
ncbi:MAG TPA: hypothetical protein DEF34_05510 [Desulfotomaculum sp.]|nr:MAG: hypothetical protein VR67_07220 [Peptococcaceae bacterium BRH_c8a]KJS73613.1 MAG: hypothetical protein JL56_11055 [Desulfotomaculum sp. BICA1-6]HBX23073.1 hypothetical protein [Desulfotomaculum sp.]